MVMVKGSIFRSYSSLLLLIRFHVGLRSAFSREIFKPPVLVTSDGGIHIYLYPLSLSSHGSHTAMFLNLIATKVGV
eukprot:XP_024437398.1 uncharacterized protein LOC18102997 isoform X2 [Populus trichocarpa]